MVNRKLTAESGWSPCHSVGRVPAEAGAWGQSFNLMATASPRLEPGRGRQLKKEIRLGKRILMPKWRDHEKIAELDGIDRDIMRGVNGIIDLQHTLGRRGELPPGVSSGAAEWALVDIVLSAIDNIEDEYKRLMGLKAAVHHYTLDYIEKIRQRWLIEIARERGLGGVYRHLQGMSDDEIRGRVRGSGIASGED